MTFTVYAIKDDLRNMFHSPVFFRTEEEGLRYFKTAINNNTELKYNSSDFSFWELGTFDDESGVFESDVIKQQNGRSVVDD